MDIEFPDKLQFLFQPARYKVARGGRGCIHRDTLIDTPKGQVKVSDFKGGLVYVWDGSQVKPSYAGAAQQYQEEDLYLVKLSNGEEIACTDEHKFLTPAGWLMLKEIHQGDSVASLQRGSLLRPCLPLSSLDISQPELREDALHLIRTALSFLYCYWSDHHRDGELPQFQSSTYLEIAHTLAYELQHSSRVLMHEDDLEREHKHSPSQFLLHLSNLAYLLLEAAQSYEELERNSGGISSVLPSGFFPAFAQSHAKSNLERLIHKFSELCLALCSSTHQDESLQKVSRMLICVVHDNSYSDSIICNHDHHNIAQVQSIEHLCKDNYFDLFVPIYNNYLSNGIVNHNSGKSWGFARALLILGTMKTERVLCCREIQKSIKQSVHQLLKDQIEAMGLGYFYQVLETEIRGKNGTRFYYSGLSDQTVDTIKSFEGCTKAWVEEGQAVTERSWSILAPTIRTANSEIWVTYNPELETDPTHVRFVIDPPPDCVSVLMNWEDNPWFPEVLEKERQTCLHRDPEGYKNIWGGECKPAVAGAIYYNEVAATEANGRICNVPYDPMLKVHLVWDLGWNDAMTISLIQKQASALNVIGYYEDSHQTYDHFTMLLKENKYNWGKCYLPHDGRARNAQTGKSAEECLTALGWDVAITPNMSIEDGIKLTRMTFGRMYFDKEKTKRLIQCAKRYKRSINAQTQEPGAPLHDEFSHGADNLRYICVNAESMTNEEWGGALKYPRL